MKEINKRPGIIAVICILGFIFILCGFPIVFSHSTRKMGVWFPALFGSMLALKFISMVGIWHLKKWGPKFYILIVGLSLIIKVLLGVDGFSDGFTGFYAIIVMIICMVYYPRMTRGL